MPLRRKAGGIACTLPPATPGRSIYWFFNQGQAARACCVSKSLVPVHLGNTPKTKVNKHLASRGGPAGDTCGRPLRGCLSASKNEVKIAPQETCRSASKSVSLSSV